MVLGCLFLSFVRGEPFGFVQEGLLTKMGGEEN